MAARKGNKYYLNQKSWRQKDYTPDELWNCAVAYAEHNKQHPVIQIDFRGKDAERVEIPIERPLTLWGFCTFAEIIIQTFYNYEKEKDYFEVCSRIRHWFTQQKIDGAIAGVYNANIVARIEGLAESVKQSIDINRDEAKKLIPFDFGTDSE